MLGNLTARRSIDLLMYIHLLPAARLLGWTGAVYGETISSPLVSQNEFK